MDSKTKFLDKLKYSKDQREGRELWAELIDRERKRPLNEDDRKKIGAWLRASGK